MMKSKTTNMQVEPSTKKKRKVHYVNNKDFLNALIEHKNLVQYNKENNIPPPKLSKYIGECIELIAKKLSLKKNFNNYTFKEEMIGDGIENCFIYLDRFNPEKSNNPFAYFTQVIKNAFIQRILDEQKEMYTRYKISEYQLYSNMRSENSGDTDNTIMDDFVRQYEKLMDDKKIKNKQRALKNT